MNEGKECHSGKDRDDPEPVLHRGRSIPLTIILHPCETRLTWEGKSVPHVQLALDFNTRACTSPGKHEASVDSRGGTRTIHAPTS